MLMSGSPAHGAMPSARSAKPTLFVAESAWKRENQSPSAHPISGTHRSARTAMPAASAASTARMIAFARVRTSPTDGRFRSSQR